MITNEGLQLIKYFEGCEFTSYKDSAGILTIGYGHTKDVQPNQTITEKEATNFLQFDLSDAEQRVNHYVKVQTAQCELDSLISQAYNIRSFPALAEHLNNDGRDIYLSKLLLYCHDVAGKELLGLKRRRYAERWLFEGQTWTEILPKLESIT